MTIRTSITFCAIITSCAVFCFPALWHPADVHRVEGCEAMGDNALEPPLFTVQATSVEAEEGSRVPVALTITFVGDIPIRRRASCSPRSFVSLDLEAPPSWKARSADLHRIIFRLGWQEVLHKYDSIIHSADLTADFDRIPIGTYYPYARCGLVVVDDGNRDQVVWSAWTKLCIKIHPRRA